MKQYLLATASLLVSLPAGAGITPEEIDEAAAAVQPQVVEWPRWFHQNPELSNREFNTSERVAEILRGMQEVMGQLPNERRRGPLEMEVQEKADAGNYLRLLVTYQSEPDSRAPAYLCVPKDVWDGARKAPAVLCLHPTDNTVGHKVVLGLGGRPGRQYAAELAERGYVTLAPSYPQLANYWPNLGRLGYVSGTMKAIWDLSLIHI